ncbi:S8 family serine peptidase [Spongiactinospora gelatinilytica]|nr:S8 family serine peptidase [Spongiactinospora gelatinilytica]
MKRHVLSLICVSFLSVSAPPGVANAAPAPLLSATQDGGTVSPSSGTSAAATVTLITGDNVTVDGRGRGVTIQRGEGREKISFAVDRSAGRLRVVPSDAAPALDAGTLDRDLFDVTGLIAAGYARTDRLPLIVTYRDEAAEKSLRSAATGAATVVRDLPLVNGLAIRAGSEERAAFWLELSALTRGGRSARVWLDRLTMPLLVSSVKQVGAPTTWERGHTGAGVKVAVLDSGIDTTHPDLEGKVSLRANFTEASDGRDLTGHGTHVAATVAGAGQVKGVAPGAVLLDGKVCDIDGCPTSSVLAGMQWSADNGAKVINLSLGSPDREGLDLLEQAVQLLSDRHGVLVVAAAGNGYGARTLSSPASADAALAVGAVNRSDGMVEFSSRGPRVGDSALKPEITAPGTDIVAARSRDSGGDGLYVPKSGTSMAAPHVAGAAAILAGQHPDWDGRKLKAALMAAATPSPDAEVFAQGAGRLDVARATTQSLTSDPAAVSFGLQLWPNGDRPVKQPITYRNDGAEPVTLALAIEHDAHAVFTVTPSSLVVPPGGVAEAVVTADVSRLATDRPGGAYLSAGGDRARISTPLGIEKESEKYPLTIKYVDRAGQPGTGSTQLRRLDDPAQRSRFVNINAVGSEATVRLAKGVWELRSVVREGEHSAYLVHPALEVRQAGAVVMDARMARPVEVILPAAAEPQWVSVNYGGPLTRNDAAAGELIAERPDQISTAQLGTNPFPDETVTRVDGLWTGSDGLYRLAWSHRGGMVTGFRKNVERRHLATVRADYAAQTPGTHGIWIGEAQLPDLRLEGYPLSTPVSLPAAHTLHVNSDGDMRWRKHFTEIVSGGKAQVSFEDRESRFEPGRHYVERWNRGVFAPVLAQDEREETASAWREGDTMTIEGAPLGDSAGRTGRATYTTVRTALHRNGALVGESPSSHASFDVPKDESSYRLVMESEHRQPAALSSRTSTAWTFRSAGAGETARRLPLSIVRFKPPLDSSNTAPSGRPYLIPVSVERLAGSDAGPPRSLELHVSFDDGANWARAEAVGGVMKVRHPARDGFVSLRARATDTRGNTVEQTIIRAYRTLAR